MNFVQIHILEMVSKKRDLWWIIILCTKLFYALNVVVQNIKSWVFYMYIVYILH